MKPSTAFDKTIYLLVASIFVAQLVLVGCSSTESDGVELFEEGVEQNQESTRGENGGEPTKQVNEPQSSDEGDVEDVELEMESDMDIPTGLESDFEIDLDADSDEEVTMVYADGSYSSDGCYGSPAGNECIGVTITVENDVVTDVSVSGYAENETSQKYQKAFASGISGVVVGKSLDELTGVGVVNGSSLTPEGFNQALASVKANAKQ